MRSNSAYMLKYILKRLGLMLLTFAIIMTICFWAIKLLPLPAVKEMGKDINIILQRREAMGYNKPIIVQYWRYWKHMLQGDLGLGEQLYAGREVAMIMMSKLPYSIVVNLYSILIAIPLGILFGIYAALKKNKWQDHVISTVVMVLVSVPSYVYAFLVQYFLCFKTGWFSLTILSREVTPFFSWAMFRSMFPAVVALALGTVAGLTRFVRAELSEVLTGDYMLLARTKGLTKRQAIERHAMKLAMVPILPMILSEFLGILGGSFIIENIFGIPGIGSLYINAINVRDYNFFMALSLFYTFIDLVAGLIIDLSYGFIDPRIKMGAK